MIRSAETATVRKTTGMATVPQSSVSPAPARNPALQKPSDDAQWSAVLRRDRSADGSFVYAVVTTGIYCRPSCPSRKPHRARARFFSTPALAAAAGYRACRRCQPGSAHPEALAVRAACRVLDAAGDTLPTLQDLGRAVGISPTAVQKLFRRVMGLTPRQYLAARRTRRFQHRLAAGRSVTEALYEAGYSSSSRVYEAANDFLGMTPGAYRRRGAEETIRYTLASSPLGRILVAATQRGICAVSFGDTDAELVRSLEKDFANARLQRDDAGLKKNLSAVLGRMTEHPTARELPLDLRATAFQRRVWQALREIPRGQTRSYSQVAAAIGQPSAVRAAARACGQNRLALLVPCHRVVGKNGSLTGYRWGTERKRNLLAWERESALPSPVRK